MLCGFVQRPYKYRIVANGRFARLIRTDKQLRDRWWFDCFSAGWLNPSGRAGQSCASLGFHLVTKAAPDVPAGGHFFGRRILSA